MIYGMDSEDSWSSIRKNKTNYAVGEVYEG